MKKKILIVGGVAGGASAAARLRRLSEEAEIIVFERGLDVSFSNCSLPFHLSGIVPESTNLVMVTPEYFQEAYSIDVRNRHEVCSIDREKKLVEVKALDKGMVYLESYDKLILSPGAVPVMPKIEGIDKFPAFTVRNVQDIEKLNHFVKNGNVKKMVVAGGGFIGMEVAENLAIAGVDVTVVEAAPQIMNVFDYDMVQTLHKVLVDNGINLIVDDRIEAFTENGIVLNSGKIIEADGAVIALGVAPETALAEEAGLELGETRAIKVDEHYLTNDKDIYAIGDAIEVENQLTMKKMRLTLAGPAQKQAREVANHIFGLEEERKDGYIGSSCIKLFDYNAASTGLNEKSAKMAGFDYDFVYVIPNDKVGLMPEANPLQFKLLYDRKTLKILGAQAIGKGNVDKRVDVIAALISQDADLEDLKNLELCYSPMFGTAKDVVNYAAMVALNISSGAFRQVPVSKVRMLVKENSVIIDVRDPEEYEAGHIIGAKNIPLWEIRKRMDEIPKDVPVYLHCRTSQRSYNALMALKNSGYDNLYNISGSFLGLSMYEYYNDMATGRDKILTAYNFE